MAYRCLHDDVPHSRTLGRLTDAAERLYMRILAVTDPWGRVTGDLNKLRLVAIPSLPWDDDKLHRAIVELEQAGAIDRYLTGGVWVIQVVNFDERQLVATRRRSESRFPARTPASTSSDQHVLSLPLLTGPEACATGAPSPRQNEPGVCDLGAPKPPANLPPGRKFDHEEARQRLEGGERISHLAREYGVSTSAIYRIMGSGRRAIDPDPPLDPKMRMRVLQRDGNRCVYCPKTAEVVDHVIPRSLGGPDDEWNLVASCQECNQRKGSKLTESALTLWEEHGGDRMEILQRVVNHDAQFKIRGVKRPANGDVDRKTEDREDRRESGLPTDVVREPARSLSVSHSLEESLAQADRSHVAGLALVPTTDLADNGLSVDGFARLPAGEVGLEPGTAEWLLARLRDSDAGTLNVLASLRKKLPAAAFVQAAESLDERKVRTDKPQVQSDVRYVVSALKTMLREGTYRQEGAAA